MNQYPRMMRVAQALDDCAIDDLATGVHSTFQACDSRKQIKAGDTVAIAVGSRGINRLAEIVKALVESVTSSGANPVIVPAMGSHGGATAAGQSKVLSSHGITRQSMGCEVVSSMETISIGKTKDGFDVRFDKNASTADHIVLVNRIKPHTRLIGPLQSGLIKMLLIGLGKHQGAAAYHQAFAKYDYRLADMATEITEMILGKLPVCMGMAIVEDATEQASHIEAVAASDFLSREPQLLKLAESRMPSLPFRQFDFLMVDQIGKEISGTGMDTNVIGRKWNDNVAAEDEWPKINQIYVRRLTDKTAGNATGIGIAAYCHRRVVDAMDAEMTKVNCITSEHPTAGRIPLTYNCDRDVLDAVISQCSATPPSQLKWMAIKDTLSLGEFWCSEAWIDEVRSSEKLSMIEEPRAMVFDDQGDVPFLFSSKEPG